MRVNTSQFGSKLTAIEANVALMEAYNEAFQINCGPTGVEMSPVEYISTGSMFAHRAKEYAKLDIYKHFHISLNEYMSYPRDAIKEMNDIAIEFNRTEGSLSSNVLRDLQNLQQK